jgi:3-hydroxybutyryl-CoA dehydrogenase
MTREQVAVVGLGFLGRGIAASLLSHGYRVIGYARSTESLANAEQSIRLAIDELVDYGGDDASLRTDWTAQYLGTSSFDDLASCAFVIESVTEDIEVKGDVFDEIERVVAADVPVASNTSAIPISTMQRSRRCPERFLGMHWAEPAHATRFLELIRGDLTGDAAFKHAIALALRCGKEPSFVDRDVPGFIANRLGYAIYREALHLIESGVADAETIDRSFRNSIGLWATLCGPFRWMDLTGGPALYAKAMAPVLPSLSCEMAIPQPLAALAREDALGVINGRGFFNYLPEEATDWEESFRRHAWAVRRLIDEGRPLEAPP